MAWYIIDGIFHGISITQSMPLEEMYLNACFDTVTI